MHSIQISLKAREFSEVRRTYLLNHSNLRGLARHELTHEAREQRLMKVCMERRYWHGDQFTPPASLGARIALRTLDAHLPDMLQLLASCAGLQPSAKIPVVAKQLCRVRMAAYQAYRPGRLPG